MDTLENGSRNFNYALLYEIMPQYSCWILVGANISCNIDVIVFNHRSPPVFPLCSKKLSNLCKSRKAPVTLLDVESVIGGCIAQSADAVVTDA